MARKPKGTKKEAPAQEPNPQEPSTPQSNTYDVPRDREPRQQ